MTREAEHSKLKKDRKDFRKQQEMVREFSKGLFFR